ncbi:hypothetical protein QTO34_009555 [Cnephaeus nilssonii]|uniref:Uncharacterized protein n=1 Tax=Cnephaeus nilssonii TaxID=3371016 RepID=A0AA40HI54_CNENI|nr:hypothetical protein QTO34_009555 [Eptesicus nilssonii]
MNATHLPRSSTCCLLRSEEIGDCSPQQAQAWDLTSDLKGLSLSGDSLDNTQICYSGPESASQLNHVNQDRKPRHGTAATAPNIMSSTGKHPQQEGSKQGSSFTTSLVTGPASISARTVLSVGPRMPVKYEDLQSLESEKKSWGIKNGLPPPPAFLQHLCFGPFPLLISLGLIFLLMSGICVIGSKNANMRRDLETLRASFSNFTSSTVAEVQALHSQGEPGWKGLWMEVMGSGVLSPEH